MYLGAQSLKTLFLCLVIPSSSGSSAGGELSELSVPTSCPGVLAFIKPGRGGCTPPLLILHGHSLILGKEKGKRIPG